MTTRIERIVSEINDALTISLPWLDKAFPRAERLAKSIEGRTLYIPGLYDGSNRFSKNEYMALLPDSRIGNFSFFWFPDPVEVGWVPRKENLIKQPFSLIFWLDLRKVWATELKRNKEGVRDQILRVLSGDLFLSEGSFEINRVYELPEHIYREFTLSEVDNQFLMHPFTGFRFDGFITYYQQCL